MHALRSCDFCGGDALGTFEVLPPELDPAEAEQRRVVLCRACRSRLENLLEPLLARVSVDGEADATRAVDSSEDDGTGHDEGVDPIDSARSTDSPDSPVPTVDPGSDEDETPTDDGETPTDDGERGAGESGPSEVADDAGNATNEGSTGAAVARSEEGVTLEHDGSTTEDETIDDESATEEGPTDDESATTGGAAGGELTTEGGPATDGESTDGSGDGGRPPRAYGKVVRLLRNREFSMNRNTVEALAAGAYDLETHEVVAVVDYAIERGEFVEANGDLRRP